MSRIAWFNFTKLAIETLPKTHIKNINNHFVISTGDNFMIMTTKPVPGMNNYFVSSKNIEGENKPQFITGNVHKFNPMHHVFEHSNKGDKYYELHQSTIDPIVQHITSK